MTEMRMKVNFITVTSGDGYWSKIQGRRVRIISINVPWVIDAEEDDKETHGELLAYFDQSTWDNVREGIIYTDKLWIQTFRAELKRIGFSSEAVEDVCYSEAGMQGNNYVSMDIGQLFIQEFKKLSAITT